MICRFDWIRMLFSWFPQMDLDSKINVFIFILIVFTFDMLYVIHTSMRFFSSSSFPQLIWDVYVFIWIWYLKVTHTYCLKKRTRFFIWKFSRGLKWRLYFLVRLILCWDYKFDDFAKYQKLFYNQGMRLGYGNAKVLIETLVNSSTTNIYKTRFLMLLGFKTINCLTYTIDVTNDVITVSVINVFHDLPTTREVQSIVIDISKSINDILRNVSRNHSVLVNNLLYYNYNVVHKLYDLVNASCNCGNEDCYDNIRPNICFSHDPVTYRYDEEGLFPSFDFDFVGSRSFELRAFNNSRILFCDFARDVLGTDLYRRDNNWLYYFGSYAKFVKYVEHRSTNMIEYTRSFSNYIGKEGTSFINTINESWTKTELCQTILRRTNRIIILYARFSDCVYIHGRTAVYNRIIMVEHFSGDNEINRTLTSVFLVVYDPV